MRKPTFPALLLAAGLAACAGAPAYRSSDVPVPPAFRETTVDTVRSPAERMPPRPAVDSTAPGAAVSDSVVPPAIPAPAPEPAAVDGQPADQSAYWRTL
jgi:hypothetical protein